jgi:hypothetical protein
VAESEGTRLLRQQRPSPPPQLHRLTPLKSVEILRSTLPTVQNGPRTIILREVSCDWIGDVQVEYGLIRLPHQLPLGELPQSIPQWNIYRRNISQLHQNIGNSLWKVSPCALNLRQKRSVGHSLAEEAIGFDPQNINRSQRQSRQRLVSERLHHGKS